MTSHLDLDTLHLYAGSHEPDGQMCLLELAAFIAGEPWSDRPACVSPVLAAFGRAWNDALDDQTRQRLIPYVVRQVAGKPTPGPMIGTAGDGADEARAWMLTDWLARTCAPAFLRCAGLTVQAERLEQAPPITGPGSAVSLQATLDQAVQAARAAGDAAGAAARDAAWDAAWARLQPTVTTLQESAFDLLGHLCDAGRVEGMATTKP